MLISSFSLGCIIVLILLYFRKAILKYLNALFFYLLKNYICQEVICWYSYLVIMLRGVFETQSPLLILLFTMPNFLYLYETLANHDSILANPFLWMSFWFSLGLSLISLDQLGSKISMLCKESLDHPFSKVFNDFLKRRSKTSKPFLEKGFLPTFGKLSAAGQAALFTGGFALVTGIGVTSANIWYNERKDARKAAKEDADRAAQTAKDTADRAAKAAKRDYQAAEAQRARDHERAENAARYAENTAQRAENTAQREHEKQNKSSTSGWWGRQK